jgi:hypothetical protein
MQTRVRFLRSIRLCGLIVLVTAAGFMSRQVSAQAVLDKTTLGQSQNDSRDLANSLVPGPKKFGKGEKKQEVNPVELKSKSIKDTTFGGSLLNMGIDPAAPKLDESKVPNASSQKDSNALREPASVVAKESKQSETTAGQERRPSTSTATSATGDTQSKDQKSTSAVSGERRSTNSTEKSSSGSKPDGGEH